MEIHLLYLFSFLSLSRCFVQDGAIWVLNYVQQFAFKSCHWSVIVKNRGLKCFPQFDLKMFVICHH